MNSVGSTIAALSTPPGVGALAMVRVSGGDAVALVAKLFRPSEKLLDAQTHTLHFGVFYSPEGEALDEVVCGVFRGPKSYTGEDIIEITCHGSPYIQQKLLEALYAVGIQPADPGEFTMRALRAGRLTLDRAEAVADLIAADSPQSHALALSHLRDGFARDIHAMREALLELLALLELELDFGEEDVEFANRDKLTTLLVKLQARVDSLAGSYRAGRVLKEGVATAIIGAPNAGKSTLLNALLGEERAIVSPIAGTTRDIVEDSLVLGGVKFRLLDTAGIREETQDTNEAQGIARSRAAAGAASLVLYVIDLSDTSESAAQAPLYTPREGQALLKVYTKSDINLDYQSVELKEDFVYISAKTGDGLEGLREAMVRLGVPKMADNETVVTNARHAQAMTQASEAISEARSGMAQNLSQEFVAQPLKHALHYLGLIVGEVTPDDVLGAIFLRFCIGK